jgi:hypothetical protein
MAPLPDTSSPDCVHAAVEAKEVVPANPAADIPSAEPEREHLLVTHDAVLAVREVREQQIDRRGGLRRHVPA